VKTGIGAVRIGTRIDRYKIPEDRIMACATSFLQLSVRLPEPPVRRP
jgi:hypothetical protein